MRPVPSDIAIIVMASVFWRPILSPSGPKKMPPKGRARKLTAKTAYVMIMPVVWSVFSGWNTFVIVAAR